MLISEVEKKFDIQSEHIDSFIKELLDIKKLGSFTLLEPEHQDIIDAYYDFPDGKLLACGHYLRLRAQNREHLITLRLIKKFQGFTLIDELTHQLNDAGMQVVLSQLARAIPLKGQPDSNLPSYDEILHNIGLSEFIRVVNARTVRDVFTNRVRVFRLKCDSFSYVHKGRELSKNTITQLELDYYRDEFSKQAPSFLKDLQTSLGVSLQESLFGKVEIGMQLLKST